MFFPLLFKFFLTILNKFYIFAQKNPLLGTGILDEEILHTSITRYKPTDLLFQIAFFG